MIKHLLALAVLAGIAVLLPLPFSVLDIFTFGSTTNLFDWLFSDTKFLSILNSFALMNPVQKFYLNFFGAIIFESLWAIPTYFMAYKLSRLFIKRESSKKQLEDVAEKFKHQSAVIMFIAAATPFPFTLTIYAAGILKYSLKRMLAIIFFGRMCKYIVMLALPYFTGFDVALFIESLVWSDLVLIGGVVTSLLLIRFNQKLTRRYL